MESLQPLTDEELDALDDLDLDAMTDEALSRLLARVRLTYPAVAAREPAQTDSDAYLIWQEDLETLDDYLDELTERLAPDGE